MSIEKRGNVWRARYRGPDRKECNRSFPRKIDAQRWLTEQKARMTRGEWVDPASSRMLFGVVAAEWQAATLHLKPKTRDGYERVLRLRVLPTWERVPLSRINHDRLTEWIGTMITAGIGLLAYTGLRWGEATALQVRDVDLGRRRLDVRRAFADIGGKLIEGTPKTHQARTVPLSPRLCRELEPYVLGRDRDALVFTTATGGPLRKSNFRGRVWAPAVRAAGLEGLTPHGLRHTAASLYIAAGTPPKVVQRILGHASITITLDLYGHLCPDEMDTWATKLGKIADEVWPECGQEPHKGDDEPTAPEETTL
jgi:integrase